MHRFGSWILGLVFVLGFVTDWQYGLRDLFRTRPRKPFARCSLTISAGHPENEMLCIFLSKMKYE